MRQEVLVGSEARLDYLESEFILTLQKSVGRLVSDDISKPPEGISNISEWCKKDACWSRLKGKLAQTGDILPAEFISELVPVEAINEETKDAAKTQKIDNGIQAQSRVLEYSGQQWRYILEAGIEKGIYSQKEIGILEVAARIPHKLPSEKQAVILLDILEKAGLEGIMPS